MHATYEKWCHGPALSGSGDGECGKRMLRLRMRELL